MADRPYTSKQMGDACEMLVAAEMTLAGVPAPKVPDNWPCYVYDARDEFDWLAIVLLPDADVNRRRNVIAQPNGGGVPQRISVKSRTFKRQVEKYRKELQKEHVGDWTSSVETYN